MPSLNQKGIVQVAVVLFLLVGVGVGVYLVQQKTNLFPKAAPKRDTTVSSDAKSTQTVFEAGFNVSGITHYGYPDLFPHSSSSQIETTLKEIQSMSSKIIRVFVANKQISDEEAARRLDDFLTKAAVDNISVIASLIDFYDSGFSPQGINYTRCDFTPCLLGSDFFNDGYKGRYKSFVQTVIEKNKNHSNIYAWEIGNELKYESDPQVFINFMKYVSSFVKALDPSHLVATGMLSAGHTGLSPTTLYSQLPRIDIITIHQYNGDRSGLGDVSWARTNNKKVILEEFGFGGTGDRSTSIRNELNFWKVEGPAAVLQWGFIAKGIPDNGNGDRDLGMDNIWHSDYDTLFSLYKSLNGNVDGEGCTNKEPGDNQLVGCFYTDSNLNQSFSNAPAGTKFNSPLPDLAMALTFNNTGTVYARWRGYFDLGSEGEYLFFVQSNGGVRLKVDTTLTSINDWQERRNCRAIPHRHKFGWVGKHLIELEYFGTKGVIQLEWLHIPPGPLSGWLKESIGDCTLPPLPR